MANRDSFCSGYGYVLRRSADHVGTRAAVVVEGNFMSFGQRINHHKNITIRLTK